MLWIGVPGTAQAIDGGRFACYHYNGPGFAPTGVPALRLTDSADMQLGFSALLMALAVGHSPRECCQTANFQVFGPSAEVAQQVAEAAELHRKNLAKLWLDTKLDDWPSPCRIEVTLSPRAGGATDVSFSRGAVIFPRIRVEGTLERILAGPLPHELTHLLLAHHFGFQPPRWADEGAAILSEGDAQGARHHEVLRTILDNRRQFPLRQLLEMAKYPADIPCLYAQGHSVSRFLVSSKGHKVFLAFVREGYETGWDAASKNQYGLENVETLERAWLAWLEKQSNKKESIPTPRRPAAPGSSWRSDDRHQYSTISPGTLSKSRRLREISVAE